MITVNKIDLICNSPGQILDGPPSTAGILTCPIDFVEFCGDPLRCLNHCS